MKIDWYSFILGATLFSTISGFLWDQVRKMYSRRLVFLMDSTRGMIDANIQDIECRGDDDCDHCVCLSALYWAKEMFPEPKKRKDI